MNKQKNLEVAKRGLALPENFNLDMYDFCSDFHTEAKPSCGTAFCFAGYLAYQDGYPEEYINKYGQFKYTPYSLSLLGLDESEYVDDNDTVWSFFFDAGWPNSFKSLKARCQTVIALEGGIPPESEWRWGFSL